jgi:DNA repair protein RadD
MLGEGFDQPRLSVAAIFRPFLSLAPYIQFVGRIMRVVVQNDPGHPDNVGHIVTHLGVNLDERLKEFKEFENDDQAFWDKVIGGEESEVPQNVLDGTARLRASDRVVRAWRNRRVAMGGGLHVCRRYPNRRRLARATETSWARRKQG